MTHRYFGAQVKKLRKSKKMKQEELAQKIGLSVAQVKYIEDGRKEVDSELLAKLGDALDTKFGVEPLHTVAA